MISVIVMYAKIYIKQDAGEVKYMPNIVYIHSMKSIFNTVCVWLVYVQKNYLPFLKSWL